MTLLRPNTTFFQPLLSDLRQRSERAAQGLLSLGNEPLRQFLHARLTAAPGIDGALLADPVFEPTFGWEESSQTMQQLSGNLLHPKLLEVMNAPPTAPDNLAEDYTFPLERRPYRHQLAAWEILSSPAPKSLVVTSGTGSGKTECFLVPILNSLVRESQNQGVLEGVRALFIYPLNALIKSQQDRLNAWTHGLDGKVRHCLYTGALENEVKATQRRYAGQVLDREDLRASAPPLLVTNATMLEYMLVRQEDAPILKQSEGKLRWIVLDEAHTYIGSQAAEMALLLRRVMLAFKVNPKDVRFVATSATFGSDERTLESLRQFLADIGGIDPTQVEIIQGQRRIPQLATVAKRPTTLGALAAIEPDREDSSDRFAALTASDVACQLRDLFTPEGQSRAHSLSAASRQLGLGTEETLKWLDLVTGTRGKANPREEEAQAFLPLRAHLFHNGIPTIRACLDTSCSHKTGTALADARWPFGMVYTEERTHCDCGTLLLPLVSCQECNESFLLVARTRNQLSDPSYSEEDEFALKDEEADEEVDSTANVIRDEFLIANRSVEHGETLFISRGDWRIQAIEPAADAIRIHAYTQSACECPACGTRSTSEALWRYARIGTPFTLSTVISTLLEYCPPDKQPAGKTFGGRKMISFTDSRQGTAKIAVKLQQDSERNRIRGLIYHRLLSEPAKGALSQQEEQDLHEIQADIESGRSLPERDIRRLRELEEKKAQGAQSVSLTWDEMRSYIIKVTDVADGMMRDYYQRAPNAFSSENDLNSLAGMLLAREFARRPKRANSLESMGLVQVDYPKLRDINVVPPHWPRDLQAWRDYLKVLLDFFIRENSIVDLDLNWLSIIGAKIRPKGLYRADINPVDDKPFLNWPEAGPRVSSRPVLLLCKAFDWDVTTHQDQLNSILQGAWSALTQSQLLASYDGRFQFPLSNISFKFPERVGLCPVTQRFIDTAFDGLTPYTPRTDRKKVIRVEPMSLPRPDFGPLLDTEERLNAARTWLASNSEVSVLRERGLWTDVHDTVVEGGVYYRAAEHSAQQTQKALDKYEKDFKEGKLNLLSCSTTMEMGVDIGGISVVAMNNVPPHPANYLQRAGRAGRRREGRSLAMTVCKNTPHDQSVFHKPDWPFVTPMRIPNVSLQSPDLVQRHVNSWLLSHWLKNVISHGTVITMNTGAFFVAQVGGDSLARRFMQWCHAQATAPDPAVAEALSSLVRRSTLSDLKPERLLNRTVDALEEVRAEWQQVYSAVLEQVAVLSGKSSAASRAMEAQQQRIEGEYLLKELATRRFLPGYGFPTDVVAFDNRSWLTILREEQSRPRGQKRYADLPSRDRVTGLREYAPGAELVIDGFVYRSAGITLNWHVPATEEKAKETQLFKTAWYCRSCGASTSAVVADQHPNCDECGAEIANEDIRRYLVPSGFAVDFKTGKPHNDISQMHFVPVKRPWLSVRGAEWLKLANPVLGQQRSSRVAHLFHHTSGATDKGFALCLECGKAEPMLGIPDSRAAMHEQNLPKTFRQGETHFRLRGGRDDKKDPICPGSHNSWKIQQNIHLGHDSTTDALELMLCDPNTGEWLQDDIAAYSIAVALRDAIADQLGVQSEELGANSKMVRHQGQKASVIQVFDIRSGGYASQAAELLNNRDLWDRVVHSLSCSCQQACQKCLLGFDTRFEAERLDRIAALGWVNPTWLDLLAVPAASQVFGGSTQAETASLLEAVERELAKGVYEAVVVTLGSAPDQWDLAGARYLRNRLHAWRNRGLSVHLRLPTGTLPSVSDVDLQHLAALALMDLAVESLDAPNLTGGFRPAIALKSGDRCMTWATDNLGMVTPDRYWGTQPDGYKLLRGEQPWQDAPQRHSAESLQPPPPEGVVSLDLHHELDGPLQSFGIRFWAHLASQVPTIQHIVDGEERIVSLTYEDRYVRNPAAAATVTLTLYEAARLGGGTEPPRILVRGNTFRREDSRPPHRCWHDWQTDQARDAAIQAAFEYCDLKAAVKSQQVLPHGRTLKLKLGSGGSLTIQLDQGFSYWEVESDPRQRQAPAFNFHAKEIGKELAELQIKLKGQDDSPTQIYVKRD